jgi:hypothetical protein
MVRNILFFIFLMECVVWRKVFNFFLIFLILGIGIIEIILGGEFEFVLIFQWSKLVRNTIFLLLFILGYLFLFVIIFLIIIFFFFRLLLWIFFKLLWIYLAWVLVIIWAKILIFFFLWVIIFISESGKLTFQSLLL